MSTVRFSPNWIWGLLAAGALLWPARISGPLDGVPLDSVADAVVIGLVFPTLWWFHPQFLRARFARACIITLVVWKSVTAALLVPDGWCVRMVPEEPYVTDATGAPHSWDVRADWRSSDPHCSAVMTHAYRRLGEFPAWFFNLPPASNSWPGPKDRPPGATVHMTVNGFIRPRRPGVLQIATGPDVTGTVRVDGAVMRGDAPLTASTHTIVVEAVLTGDRWRFEPLWDKRDLWADSIAVMKRPSGVDRYVRPWGKWIAAGVAAMLILAWLASAVIRIRDLDAIMWMIGASVWIGAFAVAGHDGIARWSVCGLALAALLPVPTRLRNTFGAFALVAVPWLTLIVARGMPAIGHFTLYGVGHDYWTYQRAAYRIVMQGYWLEGGSPTFWFQPLYRWIAGLLHLVFGDSSVGEFYWDGACVLAMALFSFRITKVFGGFRLGLVALTMTLAVVALGTPWTLIGLGLGEISSAGFISLSAFYAMLSRHGRWTAATIAGVLATLAFYTRLNNLPLAFGVAIFAFPLRLPVRTTLRRLYGLPSLMGAPVPRTYRSSKAIVVILGVVTVGILAFAWRTWYYTGVFSVFYGTQRELLAIWQPGLSAATVLGRIAESVMMVLTVNDPPRLTVFAVPVMLGAVLSVLALAGVPRLRDLPFVPVMFFVAAVSGAFVARGWGYPGRFSVHLIAVTTALVTCALALARTERSREKRAGQQHVLQPVQPVG